MGSASSGLQLIGFNVSLSLSDTIPDAISSANSKPIVIAYR
jgi:hypothetical protein